MAVHNSNHIYQSMQEMYPRSAKGIKKGVNPPQPEPGYLSAICRRGVKCHTCTSLRCSCKCHRAVR